MSEHVEPESASGGLRVADGPTCAAVSEQAGEHLRAIDELVRGLQSATVKYRHRPLDWNDVACLSQVRDHLGGAVKRFSSAETAATLHRASRQVALELRRLR